MSSDCLDLDHSNKRRNVWKFNFKACFDELFKLQDSNLYIQSTYLGLRYIIIQNS